jgi:hypothetical protein
LITSKSIAVSSFACVISLTDNPISENARHAFNYRAISRE